MRKNFLSELDKMRLRDARREEREMLKILQEEQLALNITMDEVDQIQLRGYSIKRKKK